MKRVHLLIFLFCFSINSFAQSVALKSVNIHGDGIPKSFEGKEVRVQYSQNYRARLEWPVTSNVSMRIKDGKFDMQIIPKDAIGYIFFILPDGLLENIIGNRYFLVEPGDQVIVDFKEKGRFIGKDSFKFQLQNDLLNIKREDIISNSGLDSSSISQYFSTLDTAMANKVQFLNEYKARLNPNAYQTLKLNIESENRISKLSYGMILHSQGSDSLTKPNIESFYKYYILGIQPLNSSEFVELESSTYIDYLLELEKAKIYFLKGHKNPQRRIEFDVLFNKVIDSYKGPIRDRLLMTLVTCWISFRDSTNLYQEKALRIIKEGYSRDAIYKQMKMIGKGADVFNFKLQDTTGRFVKLSDLKGKIVILDFYFTGCTGCASLALGMKPVVDKYRDNSKVAFVSVTVDATMKMFKNAVKSGKYTHPESINLWTNGEGENYEMIKYYNMYGFPVLFIVDRNGKMLDGDPPYPSVSKNYLTHRFIAIIDGELESMKKPK